MAAITSTDKPKELDRLDVEEREASVLDVKQDIKLKKLVAWVALALMAAQLAVTDTAFFVHGHANDWNVPDAVMIAFLTENFAQSVGIVYVISNYLFPGRRAIPRPRRR